MAELSNDHAFIGDDHSACSEPAAHELARFFERGTTTTLGTGSTVTNSYLIGTEEAGNSDYREYVFVISGARLAK